MAATEEETAALTVTAVVTAMATATPRLPAALPVAAAVSPPPSRWASPASWATAGDRVATGSRGNHERRKKQVVSRQWSVVSGLSSGSQLTAHSSELSVHRDGTSTSTVSPALTVMARRLRGLTASSRYEAAIAASHAKLRHFRSFIELSILGAPL